MEGNLDEAEQDLQQVLEVLPDHVQALLLSVRLHALRGEEQEAADLVRTLARHKSKMTPEQRAQLKRWIRPDRTP